MMPKKTTSAGVDNQTKRSPRTRASLPKPRIRLPIGHPGRPSTYDPCFAPRAHRLALLGMTDVEVADQFGISPDTLYEWGRRHPEFSVALQAGKSEADARVAEALFERARGAKVPAVKIFMPPGSAEPIYAPYTEHLPPDTNAAVRWLMNRTLRSSALPTIPSTL